MNFPARGAWIEICFFCLLGVAVDCRSPHGERGLKCLYQGAGGLGLGRSPHGERGLKYAQVVFAYRRYAVAPRTGSVD